MSIILSKTLRTQLLFLYYTKYIAENEKSIPEKYKELLGPVKN
jgi:hypothetical protein